MNACETHMTSGAARRETFVPMQETEAVPIRVAEAVMQEMSSESVSVPLPRRPSWLNVDRVQAALCMLASSLVSISIIAWLLS
jgi:hypothetical protein